MSFTVMTYNVGNGRASPVRLVKTLRACTADIVALQEVSDAQAQAIRDELSSCYPHQALFPGGFAGKALLSRFPILRAELLHIGPERPDLEAAVEIEGMALTLLNVHPPPPRVRRFSLRFDPHTWKQIETVTSLALKKEPCILLGDFNLVDSGREYLHLHHSGLKDAFREAGKGRGLTLPRRIGPWKRLLLINRLIRWAPMPPLLRVDYIWHTADLAAEEAWVGEDAGSDHLPVLARMNANQRISEM
jgi:endonuclease/exonuclease/phosphatase (EEP) superfamily protein YafD